VDCYNVTTVRYRLNAKRVLGIRPHPGCSEDHGPNNPLQSAHPGGALVGFVDGTVVPLSEDVDLAILLRLANRQDGQPVDRSTDLPRIALEDAGVPIRTQMTAVSETLDRARNVLANLATEINKKKQRIALEVVNLEKLKQRLAGDEQKQARKWDVIKRLRDDLARGDHTYVYASGTYTAKQVEADLTKKFDRYTTSEATLKQNREVLGIRKKRLSAAQEKLKTLSTAKQRLLLKTENLGARLKMAEVATASSEPGDYRAQLSEIRQLLSEIEGTLEMDTKSVNTDGFVFGKITIAKPAEHANVVERIAEYETTRKQERGESDTVND